MTNRRQFMFASAATLATSQVLLRQTALASTGQRKHPICVFTKPFNSLSFDELADRIAELGFDGIEAPIRRGGHIEPEHVADRLPALVDAMDAGTIAGFSELEVTQVEDFD